MQELQLYIQGHRVELFKDESVSITQSIQNVRDIAKVFTDFSKTFSIPATKKNNRIFKHYYNFDIDNTFDARIKVDARIELNNSPFRNGKIKLEGVDLRDNKAHSYKVTFFGSTIALKEILGDDKLNVLNKLNLLSKKYEPNVISNYLALSPSSNDIIIPLITHTQQLYYNSASGHFGGNENDGNLFYDSGQHQGQVHGVRYDELKYAIRISKIIEAIEYEYNLTFSEDFFNSSNKAYYDLFMWMHRKKGKVENTGEANGGFVNTFEVKTDVGTETQTIDSTTLIINGDVEFYDIFSINLETTSQEPYNLFIYRDGLRIPLENGIVGNKVVSLENLIVSGSKYELYIEAKNDITFTDIYYSIDYTPFGSGSSTVRYSTNQFIFFSNFDFVITQQIPEMKVIDFLTSLFKMFNLTAYIDRDTNKIIVKTLDSFYASGVSYDITKYVDTRKSSVNVALPYREIDFGYEDTDTLLAATYEQKEAAQWGTNYYNGDERDIDGGIYKVTPSFSHMMFERLKDINDDSSTTIQYGRFVDDNEESYIGKPLLFYPIYQTGGTSISFVDSLNTNLQLVAYNIPSNSRSIDSNISKENIHFDEEVNEYTNTSDFEDTLFKKYYKNYIKSVFNKKNRLTKLTAYLPLRILLKYTLADRFIVNGHSYKINSITTNLQSGKSELELLNDIIILEEVSNTTPPSDVQGLTIDSETNNAVSISWNSNTETNLAGYKVYVDGVLEDTLGTQTNYTILGLLENTTYLIRVTAFDANGNESSFASATEVTAQTGFQDTTPPTTPTNLSADLVGRTQVTISWTASTDNVAVNYYRIYLDGVIQLPTEIGTTYTIFGLQAGTQYTINVDAVDTSGNASALSSNLIVSTTL